MRSHTALNPANEIRQKIKSLHQKLGDMAAANSTTHQFTFYENLYLRGHKKTASLPTRIHRNNQKQVEKRHTTPQRERRNGTVKCPVNNPLLDSPPPSRPLTLATQTPITHQHRPSTDDTNNNSHIRANSQHITEHSTTNWNGHNTYANVIVMTSKEGNNSIYNHLISPPLRRSRTLTEDHVYEVIPVQSKPDQSHSPTKKHYDANNYLIPPSSSTIHYPKNEQVRMRRSRDSTNSSNLRHMRRMGRSVDSISNCVSGSKLRSQSTILAPQLWIKSPTKACLAGSSSCGNLNEQTLEFGRLSRGLTIQDKENTSPDQLELRRGEVDLRTISTSSSNHSISPRHKLSADNVSQKSSNSSLHSSSSRNSHTNARRFYHRHSSSYAGSTGSAYENMDNFYRSSEASNYVNIQEVPREKELNYADLDFTPIKSIQHKTASRPNSSRGSSSVTAAKSALSSTEEEDNHVEYTLINITATEAARKACAEHQRYRERRVDSTTSN